MDSFHYESTELDVVIGPESQLREDLADAMKDCAAITASHDSGKRKSFQIILTRFLLFAVRFFL